MIEKEISSKILHVGSNLQGKWGIAKFLRSYSAFYEEFNHIRSTSEGNILQRTLVYLGSLFFLIKKNSCGRIEIVHIHSSSEVLLHKMAIYILLSHLFGKIVVLHIHGSNFEKTCKSHQRYLRWLFEYVDLIICVSKDIENILKKYQLSSNTLVLYNVIDRPEILRVEKKSNLIHMLFVGGIIERKGIYDILEVIGLHKDYFEGKAVLYIAGGGNTTKLFDIIKYYKIEKLVVFLGWIDSNEKAKAYSSADIFLLPSYSESFGLVNLEANSYGVPVLTTDVGGIPELIHQGENGILIKPGDKKELFEKIQYLIENPYVRERMGNKGKEIASNFYPEVIESQVKAIYCDLLSRKA